MAIDAAALNPINTMDLTEPPGSARPVEPSDRRGRRLRTVGSVAAAVSSLGMIATPLNRQTGPARRVLSTVVVGGLFVTTAANTIRRWGVVRGGVAAGTVGACTTMVERWGTRSGVPFGRYAYTDALRPKIVDVPAIVPLAWFAMAMPARETVHAALGARSGPARRVVLGSAALTAWDLFLDPQMVGEGYWRWVRKGVYRGIPLSNFVGWFATGLAVMAVLEMMVPPDAVGADATLVGEYAFMAVMETLGFAAFFNDRTVAAVGGAAMLPLAVAAVAGLLGGRR